MAKISFKFRHRMGAVLSLSLASVIFGAPTVASAQMRSFPSQARYCEISAHGLPSASTAQINGQQITLSAALVIRDENNRIVVNSFLPQKFSGMCFVGPSGSLEKVWILTKEQEKVEKQNAKNLAKQGVGP
jgi:hypothetical protein